MYQDINVTCLVMNTATTVRKSDVSSCTAYSLEDLQLVRRTSTLFSFSLFLLNNVKQSTEMQFYTMQIMNNA